MPVTHTFTSAIADDAAAAAAGEVLPSHWNDSHAVDSIQIATGTITADEPAVDITQTWNNGAVTFTGWRFNVTDTASAVGSLLADWRVGGSSKASIDKGGHFMAPQADTVSAVAYAVGQANTGIYSGVAGYLNFAANGVDTFTVSEYWTWFKKNLCIGSGFDVWLNREAANVLSLYNSNSPTSAQTFRVYGTYTDSSNYVRASLASSSTAVTLAAETAGTGADNVPVNLTPAGTEGVVIGNFAQFAEMTAPAAGAANTARLFCEDNGSGKTRLMVQFASGAAQQIAIEP